MGEATGCGVTLQQTIRALPHRFDRRCRTERGSGAGGGPLDRCESVRQRRAAGAIDDGLTLAEHGLLVVVETVAPIPVAGIAVRL